MNSRACASNRAVPTGPTAAVAARLGWLGIARLGLVQAALGSVVVLVTSTLNRVMVVEYALPAMVPGILVAWHYAVQLVRPRFGFGSDRTRRRTPWILGGMTVLAAGGVLCAVATAWMPRHLVPALALAAVGYSLVGMGVGAAGTSLLVLLAKRVDERRRAAAATIMWVLMIAGFAVTSTVVGHFLDPFSPQRLIRVTASAAGIALLLAVAALFGVENDRTSGDTATPGDTAAAGTRGAGRPGATPTGAAVTRGPGSFAAALRQVWADPVARRFTAFVFVSMLAYSAEELLLEPFFGLIFGYSLGDSARLSGSWHAAVMLGMVCIGCAASSNRRLGSLRAWTMAGCCASALAIGSLSVAAVIGAAWPLRASVMALGFANGIFAVAAIGSMMELGAAGEARSAGVRMGLWGAAQAVAFALGGLCGTGLMDGIRWLAGSAVVAFAAVFALEAVLFLAAAHLAAHIQSSPRREPETTDMAVIA